MHSRPWILGVSCSHNGSACLLHGDEIVAAVQEERLLRAKRQITNARFVTHCVAYCLQTGGIEPRQLDAIVYCVTRGHSDDEYQDIFLNETLRAAHYKVPVFNIPHHHAHAVSAFATSGFREAAVLVIDAAGTRFDRLPRAEQEVVLNPEAGPTAYEWLSHYEAADTRLVPVAKQIGDGASPSLGDMYGAIGQRLFGDFFEGPGKVMGLAPYGAPTGAVENWLTVQNNGLITFKQDSIRELAMRCSWPEDFAAGADLAASVQRAITYALVQTVHQVRDRSTSANLCYAGGVALNSVANEFIVRHGGFDRVFVFPAAEDSGVAVGAAYHGLWTLTGKNTRRRLCHDALGRKYGADEIDRAVCTTPGIRACRPDRLEADVVRLLCDGKILGWFAGRSELGPRSLGQRAILCDPRRPDAKDILNSRVKHREGFRPFAPVILREHVEAWFDVPPHLADSPFMLRVWQFHPGRAHLVPAVAHVDNSARVQTITRSTHPTLYELIEAFHAETGIPMLLNTSFNVAGEPIVETPEDALWCLLSTGLDACVFEDRIVFKASDFGTILDLRPRNKATSITVEMPIVDGCAISPRDPGGFQQLAAMRQLKPFHPDYLRRRRAEVQRAGTINRPVAHACVDTPWGEAAVLLTREHLDLLMMIDGDTDGHGLLQKRCGWTSAQLLKALTDLYRAALIRFA